MARRETELRIEVVVQLTEGRVAGGFKIREDVDRRLGRIDTEIRPDDGIRNGRQAFLQIIGADEIIEALALLGREPQFLRKLVLLLGDNPIAAGSGP